MRCKHLALAAVSFFCCTAPSSAAPEFSVTPDSQNPPCADDEKIAADDYVRIHFHGHINADSESGNRGLHAASAFGYDFQVYGPQSVRGISQGVVGLCKGGRAKIVVPPELAFGDQGAGRKIPGKATIDFDIEVIHVSGSELPPINIFDMLDLNRDSVVSKEEYTNYFNQLGNLLPTSQWEEEDKNGDGVLSWEEFTLPKGDAPPLPEKDEIDEKDEL